MVKVALDLEKSKYPNSGLGQFCIHLSHSLIEEATNDFFCAYAPKSKQSLLGFKNVKGWKSFHKLTGVDIRTKVWHSLHQEAVYFPIDPSIRRVLTIHDLNFLDKYTGGKKDKMLKHLQKLVSRSSAIIYISNYTKNIAEINLKIPKKMITKVIYNGVAINNSLNSTMPMWLKGDRCPFLFTLGIVGEKKNFHVLIRMMLYLPELKLYISGNNKTKYAEEIKNIIKGHHLVNRVFLTGEISEQEKIWMYKNCSAFVFPSKNEGFGLPVVEAMSFGKPLVLSKLTSLPEIGGEVSNYFKNFEPRDMADTVRNSINNHDLKMRNRLKCRSEQFNWGKAARDYIEVYTKLLKD